MYLNLLFKSLKLDKNAARVKAFVKRFLQALMTGPGFEPSFICGGLFLLGEVWDPLWFTRKLGVIDKIRFLAL
jgi:ribosome biogenesis protein MAK21